MGVACAGPEPQVDSPRQPLCGTGVGSQTDEPAMAEDDVEAEVGVADAPAESGPPALMVRSQPP